MGNTLNRTLIKDSFSKHAESYDKYSNIQNKCAVRLLEKLKGSVFHNILDVGCGTGNYTNLLRKEFPEASIKAVDISGEMINIARNKLINKKIGLITQDAEKLTLKKEFDLITSNATFQWFKDVEKTLGNYRGALEEKGIILLSTFGPKTFCELDHVLKKFFGKDILISSNTFLNKESIVEIFKKIFKEVEIEETIYKENYSQLIDLLRKIKYCGTRGNGINKKAFWSPKVLSKLETLYKEVFGRIEATYQVFFCRGSV